MSQQPMEQGAVLSKAFVTNLLHRSTLALTLAGLKLHTLFPGKRSIPFSGKIKFGH